jgi:hypothetical protein
MAWMALMSGGVNAHSISDAAHEVEHAAQTQTTSIDAPVNLDTEHTDACSQSHCGHGHSTAMLMPVGAQVKADAIFIVPTSTSRWASSAVANNIERPKWLFSTPAVVSLLT